MLMVRESPPAAGPPIVDEPSAGPVTAAPLVTAVCMVMMPVLNRVLRLNDPMCIP